MGNLSKTDEAARQIVVDAEDLISALQSHASEFDYYLDLSTGEVVFSSDEMITGEEDGLERLIEEHPDRFLFIQAVPSSIAWNVMAEFIEQLPAGIPRTRLKQAVQHGKPFRHFKDELGRYPDLCQNWFAFEYAQWLDIARDLIRTEDIDAELKTRSD